VKTVKIPILEEFREFALRGNVADLAVGVIIGAAFGKIVTALVSDVIMPPIGRLVGNLDFTNLYLPLSRKFGRHRTFTPRLRQPPAAFAAGSGAKGRAGTRVGRFHHHHAEFSHRGLLYFLLVKGMNALKRHEEAKPTPPRNPPPRKNS